MDPRPYHYQYRKPRLNNPTYSSYNVNSSLTFFINNPELSPRKDNSMNSNYGSFSERSSKYFNNLSSISENLNKSSRSQQIKDRKFSHLSDYGNQSLSLNEREIFKKQAKKFDIISLKPKQISDNLKLYPKRTLQDKDNFYLKKILLCKQNQANDSMRNSSSLPPRNEIFVAGKHTFVPQNCKNFGFSGQPRYFTPKLLNHVDQVGNII